jgi:dCTP deaminase
MSILSRDEIMEYMNKKDETGIILTPILNKKTQINQIGIDCRLSNQFIIFKTQNMESFDIEKFLCPSVRTMGRFQAEVVVPFGKSFTLHPQTMVLGSTFEFLSLPDNIAASIEGRSSWARTGLMVATASYVEPGFKGCITLELSNVSNLPIKLFPGVRIGQIIFDRTTSPSKYKENRKYAYPIGPESSKIISDEDGRFFVNFQRPPLNDSPASPLAGRS